MRTIPAIETIVRDTRYALRVLRKSPIFTLTAVVTLAVAIGVNIAVFSVVDAVLLKPLPYPSPERLGLVQTTVKGDGGVDQTTAQHGVTWMTLRDHATTVDRAVFSTWPAGVNVVAGSRADHAEQQRVGAGFFSVLGVAPVIGRDFSAAEDRRGGPAAVVLSHHFWRNTLGGDAGIVGSAIMLRGEPHTVVGVMPEDFHTGVDADLWTPLRAGADGEGEGENYQVLLRLREGATWAQADAELGRLGAEITGQRPAQAGVSLAYSSVPLQRGLTEDLRQPLVMLAAAVATVLLVACVNLAGLLLSRGGGRTREIATRIALGSGRRAVIRQLLVESVVIAAIGAVGGLALARVGVDALTAAMEAVGLWQPVAIDMRASAAALLLALLSAALFGVLPALHATRIDVQNGLAAGGGRTIAGRASHWPRRLMVVAQVALGVVLLVGAGLLVRSFSHLRGLEPGFDGRDVYAATVSLQDARYRTAAQVSRLVDASLDRLRQSPGITAAAVSLGLPYERLLNLGFRHLDGPRAADERGQMTSATYVAGDYFAALRIPIRAGRAFDDRDTTAAPGVAIVNETFAREYFDGGNPVGRRIAFAGREREIVGVAGSVQVRPGFGDRGPLAPMPLAYIPLSQANDGFLRLVHGWFAPSFLVRAEGSVAVVPTLRAAVDASDPLLPFATVRAMEEVQAAAVAQPRLFMTLLLGLAGATVLLAAIGIYGLIASAVHERTREMGIRIALGATSGQAVRTLAAPGIVLAALGTLIGAFLARGATGLLRHFIWGISDTDPATYASVIGLLLLIAAAASIIPALRVWRLDPARTLRGD